MTDNRQTTGGGEKDKIKPVQRVLARQVINYTNNKRKAVRGAKNGQIGLVSGFIITALAAERPFLTLRDIQNRIRTECDPQEVYCYEFNNYESAIAFDEDMDAIRLIAAIWGQETTSRIKRFSPFYSLENFFRKK